MHGIIFVELRKFVGDALGPDGWRELLSNAGLHGKHYLATGPYPDEDLRALVGAASERMGTEATPLLERFGRFMVPDLIATYRALVDPGWRTLELIENVEKTIHAVVRLRDAGAEPPRLNCRRDRSDAVMVIYASPRRLCAVARGMCRGVADHYGERVAIREPLCMLQGAEACNIEVSLVG